VDFAVINHATTPVAARSRLLLAFGQFRHHQVAFGLGFLVAHGGVDLRAGRKEMSDEVAAQLAFVVVPFARRRGNVDLPSAERFGAGWQSRVQAEAVQQPVRRQAIHVAAIPLRRLQERGG